MILVEALKEAYPHHKITCEEGGFTAKPPQNTNGLSIRSTARPTSYTAIPNTRFLWRCCTKACCRKLWVYAPERNDVYMASRGKGALLNDRRIRVSSLIELNRCLIGTGFPVVDQSMMDKYLAI